ncbi:efflux RND transporter periplasmic adaptor subunit [Mucilaginibacter conchicola]|uniref:Efflux RND transporter periplasmic adaptor subunit n=1 Tax=Mucilaginibacter conchicola TaxID=2303333 RepID=A0A372NUE1_9SPHI|nr:efflux RND transporter periplasmic adaptor subunit [Mucilaginibacter conchicola]RFZ92309.1 efflux RND transporter periplasmic adaptor subunit [Mucilaginibacter conchicola]
MKRKYIIITVVVVLVGLIVIRLASNKKKLNEKNKPVQTKNVKIPVKTATVDEQVQEISIKKTGSLAPFKEVKALATAGGTLSAVHFNLGDHVVEGQVLAITDTRLQNLDLQKAQTNAARLKSDVQTYTDLYQGQAATREKLDQVRQNYTDAVNQVNQAKKNLGDAAIKAPTSGIISAKNVEQGVAVSNGSEIATIVNLSKAKVQVNLTEAEVYQIEPGQKVIITTDVYPGKNFDGKVSFISPQADATHNYLVEIHIDNTQQSLLRSGTFVYADFSRKTRQQILTIPREALTESQKTTSVFIAQDGVARLRPVKTGLEQAGRIQIISGLQKGEQIITSGQINLKDGSPINVSK